MNDIQTIQNKISDTSGEIVMYQPDETIRLEVRLGEDTVWLNQQQMAELFTTSKQLISHHIANILKDKVMDGFSVVKQYLTTAADGKNYNVVFYSLEMIIAVGYRVRGVRGTQFRQWANKVLKDYPLSYHGADIKINTDWDGETHLKY